MSQAHFAKHHRIPVYNPILLFRELSGSNKRLSEKTEEMKMNSRKGMTDAAKNDDSDTESYGPSGKNARTRALKLWNSHIKIAEQIIIIKSFIYRENIQHQ